MKKSLILMLLFFMVSVTWGQTAERWYEKGRNAADANNYDEAINCYKKAIAQDAHFALAHFSLGDLYRKKGIYDKAIIEFQKVVAIEPDAELAYYYLGIIFYRKEMVDEAIAAYEKVISINSMHLNAHKNLASAYKQKGMLDEAINQYSEILLIDPANVDAHYQLGFAQAKKNFYLLSIKHFYKASSLYLKLKIERLLDLERWKRKIRKLYKRLF